MKSDRHGSNDAAPGATNQCAPTTLKPSEPVPTAEHASRVAPAPRAAASSATFSSSSRWTVGVAVAALVSSAVWLRPDQSPSRSADARALVERVTSADGRAGLLACASAGSRCEALVAGQRVPAGYCVKTDFATQGDLRLSEGTRLTLERATELSFPADGTTRAEVLHGALAVEVPLDAQRLVLRVSHGVVRAGRAKFALRVSSHETVVDVTHGEVELENAAGKRVVARAFEQARLGEHGPLVMASGAVPPALSWSERTGGEAEPQAVTRGLGQLSAQPLGSRQELSGAVRLTSHHVRIRIAGTVARTEIEEEFTNTTDQVLEGIYRFPLPPDASIERLALEVDGRWIDGAFVDRDRAASIWRGALVNAAPKLRSSLREEIIWVPGPWRDPALLEWQRGGRFELKIFPIPRKGARRVVLAYTQRVQPAGDRRRYFYPLAHDASGALRVDRFAVDVEVRGHDPALGVTPAGYELERHRAEDVQHFALERTSFVPSGDLSFEYALPDRDAEVRAWTYVSPTSAVASAAVNAQAAPFVAIALRPRLPRAEGARRRDFAIVVDTSRSMYGESYTRAKRLAQHLIRELDPEDRLVLLACDTECQTAADVSVQPGASAAAQARAFLDAVTPDGASDPTRAVELAMRALDGMAGRNESREGRIVYIGDGMPTVGPIRPASIEASVARSLRGGAVRMTAVGVGEESDGESLSALARGGAGVMLPYRAGQSLTEATFAVLGAAYGHALSDVEVSLPDGLYAVAPARMDAIADGGEVLIVARMHGAHVDGDMSVRGKIAGAPFERRYPLRLRPSSSAGNAFVPRLYAGVRIADLEREGSAEAKLAALQLSTTHAVASRYSSLLVLESEAMFRAFGLERGRTAPEWTGDEPAEGSSAEAEVSLGEDAQPEKEAVLDATGAPWRGLGNTSAGATPAAAPRPAAKASAPSPTESKRRAEPGSQMLSDSSVFELEPLRAPSPLPRRMVPMRRIWERVGELVTTRRTPKAASFEGIANAERALLEQPNSREATRKLYALLATGGELQRAADVVARWANRDPLDADALTARADLAARSGDRDGAIRLLGSVIDVRPADVAAQRRLERLQRWAGRPDIGCRHLMAAAELRQQDAELLADTVRCSRANGEGELAERLLSSASGPIQARALALLGSTPALDTLLRGDVRIEATWSGSADLDLSLLDPEGQRVSWLGAPTRARISARDVTSSSQEALALSGAGPGEYLLEVVRSAGADPISGELVVHVAGTRRRVAFRTQGTRTSVGVLSIGVKSRLVPL